MHTVAQLRQLREKLLEELLQIPQYRALKAMERFIGEMSAIYENLSDVETTDKESAASFSNHGKTNATEGGTSSTSRVAPYLPTHRVA
jgi:hypothetical protein